MSTLWTADGLEPAVELHAEATGYDDARSLEPFTDWLYNEQHSAFEGFIESDCKATLALGKARAHRNILDKITALGVEVDDSPPEER